MDGQIEHPAHGLSAPSGHPSPYYERLRLERITPRQAAYLGNIGGVDRPLDEVALGWGEDALVDVRLVGGT